MSLLQWRWFYLIKLNYSRSLDLLKKGDTMNEVVSNFEGVGDDGEDDEGGEKSLSDNGNCNNDVCEDGNVVEEGANKNVEDDFLRNDVVVGEDVKVVEELVDKNGGNEGCKDGTDDFHYDFGFSKMTMGLLINFFISLIVF